MNEVTQKGVITVHSVTHFLTCAQEHFREPFSGNTIRRYLQVQVKTQFKVKTLYQYHPETPAKVLLQSVHLNMIEDKLTNGHFMTN